MATNNRVIWRDGTFIDWRDATVHVLSQSMQRGSLAFDYISVYDTDKGPVVFRLSDHLERLANTCRLVGLPLAQGTEELHEACLLTVRENPGAKSIRISAVLASIEPELIPMDPHLTVFIAAYDSQADIIAAKNKPWQRRETLSLKIEREKAARREDVIPPNAKVAASYTAPMTAKWRARNEGYDDIILLDERGCITEAPTANIFAHLRDGRLVTPPADIVVRGITRATMLQLAADMGIPCVEADLVEDDLADADEIFLTATSVGVWPVLAIDGKTVGDGTVGPLSKRLGSRYRDVVRGKVPEYEHWLSYVSPG